MDENGLLPSDRVEGLLHMLCEELFDDVDEVRTLACQSIDREAGMAVPLQYLLCVLDLPQARRALIEAAPAWRQAIDHLEALLQHVDAVWAEDRRGWANLESLLHAPWPVRRPREPDLRDWDVLLALERNSRFGGSWDAQLEWLHQQGSRENQADIQRILQLAAFERAHGVDVLRVLGGSRQVDTETRRLGDGDAQKPAETLAPGG